MAHIAAVANGLKHAARRGTGIVGLAKHGAPRAVSSMLRSPEESCGGCDSDYANQDIFYVYFLHVYSFSKSVLCSQALLSIYNDTLSAVANMPAGAAYRKNVEILTNDRLKIVNAVMKEPFVYAEHRYIKCVTCRDYVMSFSPKFLTS